MRTSNPERPTREVEAELFERIEDGDDLARWELYERQESMIRTSARKYANGNPLLEEEMVSTSDVAFDSALKTYKPKLDRKETFSAWLFMYLGMHNEKMARRDRALVSGSSLPDEWTDADEGRLDGYSLGSSEVPPSDNADDSLPNFLNDQTATLARMLASGWSAGECQAALGLTQSQYRAKVRIIKDKLRESGALFDNDDETMEG